jgi:DNA-binding transcriptional MerR regulator
MTELEFQIKKLTETRPAAWEHMPDIPIYMDQLVSYMERQLMDFESGETLTSSMVNNYIKAGLMPRAEEKRYRREHIALLTAICILKRVMSAKEIRALLEGNGAAAQVEELYASLRTLLDREIVETVKDIKAPSTREELYSLALELAIGAYSRQLACKRIMDMIKDNMDSINKPRQEEN